MLRRLSRDIEASYFKIYYQADAVYCRLLLL